MTRDERERIAKLEARFEGLSDDVAEIKGDVKLLVAAYHQQKGYIAAAVLFLTAIGSAIVAFIKQIWHWVTG